MASTDSMGESFRVRVEKIFGSLAAAASSPWSLTDEEVERRRWRRDDDNTTSARDETPCSSSFDDFFKNDRRKRSSPKELDGDGDDSSRDEREIRSSIGLDNTLDNEEEEDEFDKVASGRENAGERLYMSDVTNRGSYLNMHNVLPKSLNSANKDPRANHHSARIRLKEDEAEAQKMNFAHRDCITELKGSQTKLSEYSSERKSILRRKGNSTDSKPQKRVRFDPGCKIEDDEGSKKCINSSISSSSMNATDSADRSQLSQNVSRVPDYLLNPTKYTCYSFDSSSEFNEESSNKTSMDLLKLVKSSKVKDLGLEVENPSNNLPKSVTFIPRKKAADVKAASISSKIDGNKEDDGKQSLPLSGFPVGIAAGASQDYEVSMLDETEPEANVTMEDNACFKKPGRNYRMPTSRPAASSSPPSTVRLLQQFNGSLFLSSFNCSTAASSSPPSTFRRQQLPLLLQPFDGSLLLSSFNSSTAASSSPPSTVRRQQLPLLLQPFDGSLLLSSFNSSTTASSSPLSMKMYRRCLCVFIFLLM